MEAVKTRKKKGKRKSKAGENRKNDCPDTNLVTENCKENTPATTSNLLVAGEQSGTGATAVNENSKSCNEVENSETFGNQGIPDVGLSSPPCNNYGDDSVTVDTVSQEEDSLQAKAENKPLLADSSHKLDVSSDVLQPGSTEDEAVILKLEEDKNDVDVSSADVLQPRSTEDEAVILKLEEDKNDVDVSSADVLLPQSTEDEAVILKLEEDKNDVDVSSVGHGSSNIETKTFVKDDGNENFIHEETLNAASYVHESIKHRQHDESVEAPDVLHRERASTAPPLEREDSVVDQDNINEEIMEEEKSGAMPCIPESTKSISLTENIMARDVIHRERASTAPPLERENSTQHQLTDTENAQLMMPATASSLYPTLQAIKEPELQPYTEERLKEFYYNPQLAQFNQSVDTFLGVIALRIHIILVSLKSQCNNYQNSLWISTQHQLTQNGHCEDDHRVSHTYTFETVQLNSDALTFLHDVLGKIRCGLQESLSMNQYLCQLYKLHIDVYLYDMINGSSVLKHLATQTPFSSAITPQILNEHTDTLRQCISVFFAFMRRHSEDEKFIQDIKCWLNHLISLLLNVQSYDDSFFILNHLIRCPGGIGSWASQFVQPIVSGLHSSDCKWNDTALDHFIVSLGATVFPIKCRDEFLSFIPQDNSSGSRDSWTLVTEEGLEDDSVENYFLRLRESDLISIYSQFAFDKLFCYLLRLSNSGTEDLYLIQQPIDSHYVMKVFVVTSTIIKLLSSAFSTYNSIHYNQYVKTICKTIREIIHFISDFWQHYQATRAITENDWNEVPIERLVTEYDQFFMKATHAVWIGRDQEVEVTMCTERDYQDDWKGVLYEEDRLSKFANNLKSVSLSDGIHLLTIFSTMTEACETNSNFIQMVTLELFEICYVYESTRELYYKTGRELLNYISLRNPSIVTLLLHRVEFMFNEVGNMALYLFKGLPIICWTPEEEDFNLIRNWLVQCNISSLKNQLARFIISELNWSTCKRTDLLALSRPVHNETASMIVEVYTEKIKGSDFENNDFGRQIASILPANSTIALYGPQSEVLAWCWDTATHLKLHGTSLQTLSLIFSYACASKNVQVDIHNLEAVPLTATLTGTYDQMPSAYENPMLLPLRQCADDHIPLGCYLLLSMTSVGHFPSDFLAHGLRYFECIIDSGYYKASLCVLYNVIPAFFEHDENESLLESPIFLKAIESVLAADIKYGPLQFIPKFIYDKNNEITGSIASLIQTHCFHYANHLSPIEFWTRVFLNIYDWAKNECIQLIFDELAKVAFLIPDGLEIMSKIIAEKYDKGEVVKDQQSGILQSFFSWVASGFQGSTTRQSFLDEAGNGEYPWFAFVILCADQEYEIQSGILRQMTLELLQNASIGIDAALKKSISRLDIHAPYSSTNLCIYRWVQQALTTDMSHPILPLIWQKFFSLYLSQSDCGLGIRGSVGHRYFKNMSSLIHRVKERLFYQTLALWLEEPRLHDTSLYLPSLPIQYNPELLGRLYNKTGELWLEYVDLTAIYEDVYNNIRSWLLQYAPFTLASKFELSSSSHSGREEPLTRINLRLRCYEASQPPPEVKETIEPFAVLPRNLFENDQQLLSALKSDFRIIVESSQEFSTRVAALNSSDIEYLNLLPNVYHNAPSTVTVNVPCNNWLRGTADCKGPAQLTFDFQAKHEREEVSRQIQANREGYERLSKFFVTPVSEILCHAAARIELVISNLVKEFSIANTDTGRRKICSSASSVFYAIVAMLDNDTKTYLPIERFLNSCIQTLGMVSYYDP
ncbi:uncharacterized protein TRIADDRAFT_52361 [Trichoplax adhaerens]|uniref:Epg5-like TPR domain-containing protein n=1 Tax=Trichoplax adhaerens TaxID=10228 RepID=B3RI29_TRIAD|nr:hypothetical protein TRIADDRAFT_52361 [Trichoplax adhaerens]EDV29695.1 hypothetical protein TRIADDRAFT_52361 [Trichoplax adhaerens]|eukprot:XP_002108897.1 hypothetical protein TRIADDRAFT_52361 [Trichoplax adhaerens]